MCSALSIYSETFAGREPWNPTESCHAVLQIQSCSRMSDDGSQYVYSDCHWKLGTFTYKKAAFLLVWSRVEMTQPVDTRNDFPLSDTDKVSSSSAFYFTCLPDKRSSRKGQNRWQWLAFLIHDRWNSLQRFSRCSQVVSSAMCFGTRSAACPGYTFIVIHFNSEHWIFEVIFAGYEFVVALCCFHLRYTLLNAWVC